MSEPTKRVAIIAVHGVGDHPKNDMPRSIANMLLNLDYGKQGCAAYSGFIEHPIRIPVCPIEIDPEFSVNKGAEGKSSEKRLRFDREERPRYVIAAQQPKAPASENTQEVRRGAAEVAETPGAPEDEYSYQMMVSCLEASEKDKTASPPGVEAYESVRLEGTRTDKDGKPTHHVDIFEMFWDDLSKVGGGSWGILGELYQVLFHLGSVGRKVVNFAVADNNENKTYGTWRKLEHFYTGAVRFLTLPIPIFNLFLLAVLLIALPCSLPPDATPFIVLSFIPLGLFLLFGRLWGKSPSNNVLRWAFPLLFAFLPLAALIPFVAEFLKEWVSYRALAIAWPALSFLAIRWVAARYDSLRPGALYFTHVCAVFVGAIVLIEVFLQPNSRVGMIVAALQVSEILFVLLLISWAGFIYYADLAAVLSLKLERHAREAMKNPQETKRAERAAHAAWTSRLALLVAVLGFLVVTLTSYSGLRKVGASLVPGDENYKPFLVSHLFPGSWLLRVDEIKDPQALVNALRLAKGKSGTVSPTEKVSQMLLERSGTLRQLTSDYYGSLDQRKALTNALNEQIRKPRLGADDAFASLWLQLDDEKKSWNKLDDKKKSWNGLTHKKGKNWDDLAHEEQVAGNRLLLSLAYGENVIVSRSESYPLHLEDVLDNLMSLSATAGLSTALILITVALLLVLWSMLPSVLAEVVSGRFKSAGWMGHWMTNGYFLQRWAGELGFIAVAVVLPLFSLLYLTERLWLSMGGGVSPGWLWLWLWPHNVLHEGFVGASDVLESVGVMVAAGAVSLFAFRGRLEKLALGFRTPLEAGLDADNWLRESPRGDTPRRRICARYGSLLRSICNNDKQAGLNGPYDKIVIIAHSQGTVITADLLRFIRTYNEQFLSRKGKNWEYAELLEGKEVYFFSLGSPLRQLYGIRFPNLYGWARGKKDRHMQLSEDTLPDPKTLGVRQWVNAYRSGDYIGRALWRAETDPAPWEDEITEHFVQDGRSERREPGGRREFCIGAGAHTHYFDPKVTKVAKELDRLIEEMPDGVAQRIEKAGDTESILKREES